MKLIIFLMVFTTQIFAVNIDLTSKKVLTDHSLLSPERTGRAIIAVSDTTPPKSGLTALRQQNDDQNYSLFHGRLKTQAWEQLSIFPSQDIDLWNAFLQAKFYTQSPNAQKEEIKQIFWNQGIILVPKMTDSLYVQMPQGTAILLATHYRPVEISISSRTPEATIFIEDILVGHAPQKIRWLQGPSFKIRIEAPNHQPWEDLIVADPHIPTSVDQSLSRLPLNHENLPINNIFSSAHGTQDQSKFTPLVETMISEGLNLENEQKLNRVSQWIDTLNQREYAEYIALHRLTLSSWDSAHGGIPVHFWYGQNDFDFGFEGVIPCTQEESFAYEMIFKDREPVTVLKHSQRPMRSTWPSNQPATHPNAHLRLMYYNIKTPVRTNNRLVDRYFAMSTLQLLLPDRIIDIPGTFLPAGYIKSSPQWKQFMDGQD
ncbi:MAG: hypothetical protein GX801_02255 [Fibrobacter sp.]|nr:hypothetical protein [Fibrobacter sp.]